MNSSPLFIGGTGRCGTTALAYAFRQHDKTAKFEKSPRIVADPGGILDLVHGVAESWDPYRADRALWEFEHFWYELHSEANGRYQTMEMDKWIGEDNFHQVIEDLKEELIHHVSDSRWMGTNTGRTDIYEIERQHPHTAAELARKFMSRIHAEINEDAQYWIDDGPYVVNHIKDLWWIFPGMQMIHIHRHPMEVLASHQRVRIGNKMWTSDDPIANAKRVRGIYEGWIEQLHQIRDVQEVARDVKLQDLADEPEVMIDKISDFLGLEYDPRVADYVDPDKITHGTKGLDLTREQEKKVKEIFEPVADWYGYEL